MSERVRVNSDVQHQYFKVNRWKKLLKVKNIVLFGVYLAAVVIIVELADEKKMTNAYAKNLIIKELTNEEYSILEDKSLTIEEKLELRYYEEYIGNKDIARYTLNHSKNFNIEPALLIALMKVESRFNNYAVNYNSNKSIDRGLCQLNSTVFTDMRTEDFFNPDKNIMNGAKHLRWCLDNAENKLTKALALYNAGYGKVANTKVGALTLDYIQKIVDERDIIKEGLNDYLAEYSDLM